MRGAADHRVADLEPVHALAQGLHFARQLKARDEGQRRLVLVFAAGHQQVGEVDRGGENLDPHLARQRRRASGSPQHAAGVIRGQGSTTSARMSTPRDPPWQPSRTRPAISRQATSAAGTTPVKATKAWARLS